MKIVKHKYFTFKEIIDDLNDGDIWPYNTYSLVNFARDINFDISHITIDLSSTLIEKLWQEMYARYFQHYIIKVNDDNYIMTELKIWFSKLLSILSRTYDYYSLLINEYTTAKSHLMDDIKSTTKSKMSYNDTPQNDNSIGEYEGDDFITNFTKNSGETTTELNPKIIRLKEIESNFKMLYSDWVNEFERIIFEL